MIVVVAIIAILASILVGYSREAGKQLILSSNEAELVSLISRAKFLSIETFFEEASASTFRICAVGVHVDNAASEVFIFQDRVPVASDCSTATNIYEVSGDDLRMPGELDTVKLDDELVITGGGLNDVVFIPPDPDVIINNNPMQNSASINVSLIDGSGQFTVLITDAGQIRTPSP